MLPENICSLLSHKKKSEYLKLAVTVIIYAKIKGVPKQTVYMVYRIEK